jgi:predicted nuclease of restriction endonuclease-like (RecB) superfamily
MHMAATGYDQILTDIIATLDRARSAAARSVNTIMTVAYWLIGHRIIEHEQGGHARAEYGQALLRRLAVDLTARFGRGFSSQNLYQMRQFRLTWTPEKILQTASGKFALSSAIDVSPLGTVFPLPWSAYVRLLSVTNPHARDFYEREALRNGWTVRQLDRQISSQFYERTALSRDKASMLAHGAESIADDQIKPEAEIKDPFILEFLGLKDEYSETDLEDALLTHLADFLLEFGGGFAFIARQRRLRIDDSWFRVDLLLFNRRLRCLVLVDMKIGRFSYADAGQMQLYLNYARENWTLPGENPPVGLILCAEKGADEARYALDGLANPVLAAEYKLALPDESVLTAELERTRAELERRSSANRAADRRAREAASRSRKSTKPRRGGTSHCVLPTGQSSRRPVAYQR